MVTKMFGSLELLAAAFSAMLEVEVVTPEVGAQLGITQKVSVHELFQPTYVMRSLENTPPGEVFEINVKTITGLTIVVQVTNEFTIAEVKAAIEMKDPLMYARRQRLVFGRPLDDHQTVGGVGIPPDGVIFVTLNLRGGGPSFILDTDELAPAFDYDFTNMVDDGERYVRGGHEYRRPYGWYRYAINVLGRKEYGSDNTWLGQDGIRTDSGEGEWPVSYHGTKMECVSNIIKQGYKIGPGDVHGKGVYSSPSLPVAVWYATSFKHDGKEYNVVMQNRVNPAPGHLEIVTGVHSGEDYWVCKLHNPTEGVYDVRPYGVLIQEA